MNISFTREELLDLLHESPTFRGIYLNLTIDTLTEWREKIKSLFPNFPSGEKIPAIKWLRTETQKKTELLSVFNRAGYEDTGGQLGLAAAKKFVESCF